MAKTLFPASVTGTARMHATMPSRGATSGTGSRPSWSGNQRRPTGSPPLTVSPGSFIPSNSPGSSAIT